MDFSFINAAVLDAFGDTVTYRAPGYADAAITGAWSDTVPEGDYPGAVGELLVIRASLPVAPMTGHSVIRNGVEYIVIDLTAADSSGAVTLRLRRA